MITVSQATSSLIQPSKYQLLIFVQKKVLILLEQNQTRPKQNSIY